MKKIVIIFVIMALAIVTAITIKMNLMKSAEKQKLEILMQEEKQKLIEKNNLRAKLEAKADTAKLYARQKGFDLDHTFLIDFSIHSGKHRFFVWNFKTNSVEFSSLCAHGIGKGDKRSTYTNIIFSNVEGSLCSSLGKYKTGDRSYSNWGINVLYKLHGLEKTNNNAFKRWVVLHSHSPISEEETYPDHLPLGYSQGCPVVDDQTMKKIDNLIKTKEKPVLLWIYI